MPNKRSKGKEEISGSLLFAANDCESCRYDAGYVIREIAQDPFLGESGNSSRTDTSTLDSVTRELSRESRMMASLYPDTRQVTID